MDNDLSNALKEISVPAPKGANSLKVQLGRNIPPQQQILIYSSADWEEFILEWVHSQNAKYSKVRRFAGPNDMGIDIAGMTDEKGLDGKWDNFQCKHYADPLTPSIAAAEIGKILWHSFNKTYAPPRKYYFIAPRSCGTSLTKLLTNPEKLKQHVLTNWDSQCSKAITSKHTVALNGAFKIYVERFDFSIFSSRSSLEVVDEHRTTPYHAVRFGGGLRDRPAVLPPPALDEKENQSRYIQYLFEAYGDDMKVDINNLAALSARVDLVDHFHRHREYFYYAESLRNFSRDAVPPGTFEDLQTEVHAGVIDVMPQHQNGFACVNAVTQKAADLNLTSNALISVLKIQDKKGICHQLANDDRLRWRKKT